MHTSAFDCSSIHCNLLLLTAADARLSVTNCKPMVGDNNSCRLPIIGFCYRDG